jgi:hypothetical protein
MPLFTKKDWSGYLIEVVVVVLGILIAFQVDEWREGLQLERERLAALTRLHEETQTNLASCEVAVPVTANLARSIQLVLEAIQSGELRDDDIETFEYGLTHIGFLPGRAYLTTVAEEMIATGLLKELDNAQLQTSVALALTQKGILRQNVATQGRFLHSVVDELARSVELSYRGSVDVEKLIQEDGMGRFEAGIEVGYDFQSLVDNRYLRNLLIETTDGYVDLHRMQDQLCRRVREIDEQLAVQGIES